MAGKTCGIVQSIHKNCALSFIRRIIVVNTGRLEATLERIGPPVETLVSGSNGFPAVGLNAFLLIRG